MTLARARYGKISLVKTQAMGPTDREKPKEYKQIQAWNSCVYVYWCKTCIATYGYTVCMYVCMYVCIYVCIHVCIIQSIYDGITSKNNRGVEAYAAVTSSSVDPPQYANTYIHNQGDKQKSYPIICSVCTYVCM